MRLNKMEQTAGWVRRYRLFLCLILLAVLVLAGGLCYGMYHGTEIPKEGTLVHSGWDDERKA